MSMCQNQFSRKLSVSRNDRIKSRVWSEHTEEEGGWDLASRNSIRSILTIDTTCIFQSLDRDLHLP